MIMVKMVLEELTVVAERSDTGNNWTVGLAFISDAGGDEIIKIDKFTCTDEQFGAITALAVSGGIDNGEVDKVLYSLAEPLQSVDLDLRIIP